MQIFTDKVSISLSILCVVHCLVLPFILVILPNTVAMQLNGEGFHVWMIVAVIPTSVYALLVGCRNHKHYQFVAAGMLGLVLLVIGAALGEVVGELGEKILTFIGASILGLVHYKNYQLCRQKECSGCGGRHSR